MCQQVFLTERANRKREEAKKKHARHKEKTEQQISELQTSVKELQTLEASLREKVKPSANIFDLGSNLQDIFTGRDRPREQRARDFVDGVLRDKKRG